MDRGPASRAAAGRVQNAHSLPEHQGTQSAARRHDARVAGVGGRRHDTKSAGRAQLRQRGGCLGRTTQTAVIQSPWHLIVDRHTVHPAIQRARKAVCTGIRVPLMRVRLAMQGPFPPALKLSPGLSSIEKIKGEPMSTHSYTCVLSCLARIICVLE